MSEQHGGPAADGDDELGSVGEEAAKLFGALSDWAREEGSERFAGLGGLASQAASVLRDVDEHVATGSAECTYCPICRTVHVLREAGPDVRAHLTSAASSVLQAAAAMLAAQGARTDDAPGAPATPAAPAAPRTGRVERIDLDQADDGDEPGDDEGGQR